MREGEKSEKKEEKEEDDGVEELEGNSEKRNKFLLFNY